MNPATRLRSGLTLIELMVALAMLAILASLAVPEIGRMAAYWKMQATAEQLVAEINEARHDAARLGRTLHLAVQPGRQWCWSLSEVPGCGCGTPQACQMRHVQASRRSAVSIEGPLHLGFLPAADARQATWSVTMSTPHDERLRVTVTPMGRARICLPEGTRSGYPRC